MESCVIYPKEAILNCRPSLRKACGENRPAARLLSYLLFRASLCQQAKQETEPLDAVPRSQERAAQQECAITIYRTQGQIVREMDGEMCARTLRDEAIPCLVELGYLTCEEIKGDKQTTAYTLHPAVIQQGLDHPEYVPSFKTMPFYQRLLATRARKKLYSANVPHGSENVPHGSENTPDGSEFFPQTRGKSSEPEMPSRAASQAASEGHVAPPKNHKIHNKIDNQ